MEEKMRKTGINFIGDARWGSHFCLFYQSKQDLIDVLLPYFKAGLENNEFCLWVTSEPLGEKEVEKAMRKAVPNFDRYLKRGQMEIVPHTEWYLKNGSFNLRRVLNAWIDKLNQALLKGFDGLRVTGSTTWLEKRDWRNFTDYEEQVNKVISKYQMMALCTYSLDRCAALELVDVVSNHQSALIRRNGKWELIESSQCKETREALQKKTSDLGERVKELKCLYGISDLIEKPGISLEEILQGTVDLIPAAWQYSEVTGVQINLEHQTFKTKSYKETIWKQNAAIIVQGSQVGSLNICCLEKRSESDEGPFLKEERSLINTIAERLGRVIQHKRTEKALKKGERRYRLLGEELRVKNLRLKAETDKARQADRLKSEFLANVSHEIRTPLTAISGAAHLLYQSSLSDEQRDLCSMVRGSSEHLVEIINAILDLARIEARQVKVVEKEFFLKESVRNIISGFELQARKKGLEVKMVYPSHLPLEIRTDEGKLTQILSNLIANALKFTEKGKIEVRLNRESNSRIQFSVEDTGIGIPEEKLSRIFDKFYQTDGTIRREHEGVGLGLTIIKELVDLLGGKIEVKSKVGKGSLFYFSLPCKLSKQKLVPDIDRSEAPPKTEERVRKGMNILVAEDDSPTYDIIRRFLEDCTISRAVDGKDVLKKIREKSYDLVLMDIQMPEMDGLEATRTIREKDSNLPIIAVTARSFKADEEKCLAAGCNDYISKPIAPEKLIAKINQYAVKRISRRQNIPPK